MKLQVSMKFDKTLGYESNKWIDNNMVACFAYNFRFESLGGYSFAGYFFFLEKKHFHHYF